MIKSSCRYAKFKIGIAQNCKIKKHGFIKRKC